MDQCVFVVDFGTSNVRVQTFDVMDGTILFSASEKYRMKSGEKNNCEIDFKELWKCAQNCMAEAVESLPYNYRVLAVNFSFFGASIVPVDKNGEALDHAILCFDSRSAEEAGAINDTLGVDLYTRITGGECDPNSYAARILWYRKYREDIYKNAVYYWSVQEYVLAKLGFFNVSEYTMASKSEILDDELCVWSEDILKFLEIDDKKFAQVISPEQSLGKIKYFGEVEFPYEIEVYPGLHDALAGFLGLGISGKSDALAEVTGTFDHVGMITENYVNCHKENPQSDIWSSRSVGKESSVCIAYYPTSGALIEWFLRELSAGKTLEELWENCRFNSENSLYMSPDFQNRRGEIRGLNVICRSDRVV